MTGLRLADNSDKETYETYDKELDKDWVIHIY